MKIHLIMTAILFLLMIFLPLIALVPDQDSKNEAVTESTLKSDTTAEANKQKTKEENKTVSLVTASGKTVYMNTEDYIYGAVCAEMPASFHTEALKAQAVACYTYLKWLRENADNSQILTDNPSVHQAYITDSELKEKWGSSYDIYSNKVRDAVSEVINEYLTYKGETAMTVYHALSPGKTLGAEAVWGNAVPYLDSVTAPGDTLSPDAISNVILTKRELTDVFGEDADLKKIYEGIKTDESGCVTSITYKNNTLTATDLRSAFSLKSPVFKADFKEDKITLTVYGKGHGVGMSQYSADYMARQGSSYKEILAHFYKGTELKK